MSATSDQIPLAELKRQVKRCYAELWDAYNLGVIDQLLHPSVQFRGSLGQSARGHEGVAAYVNGVHAALGAYRCAVENLVAGGQQVFAKVLFNGIHRAAFLGYPPTHSALQWRSAALFEFDGVLARDIRVLGVLHDLTRQLDAHAHPRDTP
ncbi:MAG: ester cyclase [Pseudomonadota bacterium]